MPSHPVEIKSVNDPARVVAKNNHIGSVLHVSFWFDFLQTPAPKMGAVLATNFLDGDDSCGTLNVFTCELTVW